MKTLFMALLLGATALPGYVSACAQLTENVWLCDRGTIWETAEWDPYGDGSTLLLDEVIFNFTEQWPGYEIGDDIATLEEQYATYSEWIATDGGAPVEVYLTDHIKGPKATALRHLQRDQFEYEPETMSAVMLAEVGAARIMLYLDAPASMPLKDMDNLSRDLIGLLQDACSDPVSCAEDYMRPLAGTEKG